MKTIIATIFLAGLLALVSPSTTYSQSVYGLSEVGYDSNTREIFGASVTWLDYQVAWYYDPEVLSELYWQFHNEIPLDSGYGIGLSQPQYGLLLPAVVDLYSTSYLPVTLYTTYGTHFIRSYYVYESCSGGFGFLAPCYPDPFGFSNYFNGFFGPSFGWPGFTFNPFFFVAGRRFRLGTTEASIVTPPGPFCLPPSGAGQTMVTFNGATAPPCPTPTPTPTPTPQSVQLNIEPQVLSPAGTDGGENTATVTVRIVPAVANQTVTLTLTPVGDSGGHMDAQHIGARPGGQLRRRTGTTNASGEFTTTYTPSHVAGIVNLRASVGGVNSTAIGLNIRVLNLFELQAGTNYELIGPSPSHPRNHWGTAAANAGLNQIANDYASTFYPNPQSPIPNEDKLRYNDQSLTWGGKFDLPRRWGNGGSHHEHRTGINCDVRCCANPGNVPQARRAQLNNMFIQQGSTDTLDETQSAQPHWHLRFVSEAQNVAIHRNAGHFVTESFSSALEREADPDEWEERMNTFDAAHVQGQLQTLDAAKALTAALFQSVEYANRSRSDEDFVADLYTTFLLRAPDTSGYAFWLGVLRTDNNNGLDGRAHLIQAFVESPEFRNLIVGLTDTPAASAVCHPTDEQSCYSQNGVWDSSTCFCSIGEDPPDPCLVRPSLCDLYPMN